MKNRFREEIIKPVQEKETLMRANRLLSSKYALTAVILVISAVSFFFFNYCMNTLLLLLQNLRSFQEPAPWFSFQNAFTFRFRECWGFYLVVLLLIIAADIRIVYGARVSWKDYNVGQKGTERFTTPEEIQRQYRAIPAKDQRYPGCGGFPVCRIKDNIFIDDGPVNNLIIGAPRSGKGESFVFPMIDLYSRAEEAPSLVVIDPKLELYAASYQTLKSRGFVPLLLNTIDPAHSMGYNPLTPIAQAYQVGDYDYAQIQAKGLGYAWFEGSQSERDGDFWLDNSANATAAMILALVDICLEDDRVFNEARLQESYRHGKPFQPSTINEDKISMYSCVKTFTELADVEGALDIFFAERPEGDPAKMCYSSIKVASGGQTRGSILSSVLSKLGIFALNSVAKMTTANSIDLEEIGFGKQPIAVFIGINLFDTSNSGIATMFLQQLDMVLGRKAVLSKGQKCARQVVHLYDELGNIPPIPKLGARLTGGPGMNLLYTLVIHDFAQLKTLYGESANTIITGCGNKAFLMTANMDTAREFSAMVGNETITNISRIGQKLSLDKSLTESYEEHPLINPNQLMHLHRGENIIHRVLKREDLEGNPVESYPIFNHGKTRFLYRFEYLLDSFPADTSIEELPTGDLSGINLAERSFSVNSYFEKKLEQQQNQLPISKLKNAAKLIDFLCGAVPGLTRPKASKCSVGQLREMINDQFSAGNLSEKERDMLVKLIKAGEANDDQ